jgi:hypothetical protein
VSVCGFTICRFNGTNTQQPRHTTSNSSICLVCICSQLVRPTGTCSVPTSPPGGVWLPRYVANWGRSQVSSTDSLHTRAPPPPTPCTYKTNVQPRASFQSLHTSINTHRSPWRRFWIKIIFYLLVRWTLSSRLYVKPHHVAISQYQLTQFVVS